MPVEQHPIPQDVAGYRFRLIGEMTLKQFAYLAGGIIIGLIVYSLPLPFFFRYPLAAIAIGLGAGIAFLPIEGRPMDKWLIAFIKSVYSPTQYVWKKSTLEQETVIAKVPPPSRPLVTPSSPVLIPPAATTSPAPTPPPPSTQPSVAPITPAQPQPLPAPTTQLSAGTPTPPPIIPITSVPKPTSEPESKPQPTARQTPPPGALPIPFTPTTPNTLVGMTLTPESKILPGALIEIKSKGISIRATKSNLLGQFLFAKPLENGVYQIYTEKPGLTFAVYSLELTGQIVRPLRLQAQKTT